MQSVETRTAIYLRCRKKLRRPLSHHVPEQHGFFFVLFDAFCTDCIDVSRARQVFSLSLPPASSHCLRRRTTKYCVTHIDNDRWANEEWWRRPCATDATKMMPCGIHNIQWMASRASSWVPEPKYTLSICVHCKWMIVNDNTKICVIGISAFLLTSPWLSVWLLCLDIYFYSNVSNCVKMIFFFHLGSSMKFYGNRMVPCVSRSLTKM